jgi:hypothetical protein
MDIGVYIVRWMHLAQDKYQSDGSFVDAEMNARVSLKTGVFLAA